MKFSSFGMQRSIQHREPKQAFSKRAIYQRIELYNKKDNKHSLLDEQKVE